MNTNKKNVDIEAYDSPPCHSAVNKDAEDAVNNEFNVDEILNYITGKTSTPIEDAYQADSIPETTESYIDQSILSEQEPVSPLTETDNPTELTANADNAEFSDSETPDYFTNKTSTPIEDAYQADSIPETTESYIDQSILSEQEPVSPPTEHTKNTDEDENVDVLLFRAIGKPSVKQPNTLTETPPPLPHDNLPGDNLPSFVFSNKSKSSISYLIIGVALCVMLVGGYWFFAKDTNEQNNLHVQAEEQASKEIQPTPPPKIPKAKLPTVTPPPSPPANPPAHHVAPDSNSAPAEAVKPINSESGGIIPKQTEPVKPSLESNRSVQTGRSPAISIGKASAQTGIVKLSVAPLVWGKYPEGSTRLLTAEDINGIKPSEIRIMKNEIFARHSCIFKSPEMKDYFSKVPWYTPQYHDVTSMLTPIERENVTYLMKHEKN